MRRSHNVGRPPDVPLLNTKAWPSGDSANDGMLTVVLTAPENVASSGGKIVKLIGSPADEVVESRAAKNSAAPRNSTAAIHAASSRLFRARERIASEPTDWPCASSIWNRPSAMS